jgi:hypothetical protein
MEVVMASFDGSLRTAKQSAMPVHVVVDLSDERVRLSSEGIPIAEWRLGQAQISAHADGFHVRRGGEDLILTIKQDAEFAVLLDLRSVPIDLARRMAVYRDSLD